MNGDRRDCGPSARFAADDLASIIVDLSTVDGLRTAVIGPPEPQRTMAAFMGYGACVEPFEVQRFRLMARLWNCRIVVTDAPGLGYAGGRLSKAERVALWNRDYTPTALRMARAATIAYPRLGEQPITVLGYSMGCSLAAAVAASSVDTFRLKQAVLIEPVAGAHWRLSRLHRATRWEDRQIDGYLARNQNIPGAVAPVDRRPGPNPTRSALDLLRLASALRSDKLMDQLVDGQHMATFPVLIAHGTESRLSSGKAVATLTRRLQAARVETTTVSVPGHHGLWQSLPDVKELCTALSPHLRL